MPQEDMDEDEEEESTPTYSRIRSSRLAARRSERELNEDAEDERSEIEHENEDEDDDEDNEKNSNIDVSASGRPIRRVTRNRLNSSTGQDVINEVESEDEEDIPIGRRTSARRSSSNKKPRGDENERAISSEPIMSSQEGIRRSSRRTPKPILKETKDGSSSDSDDKNDENSGKILK